jgi:multidrug resistance efflux pump
MTVREITSKRGRTANYGDAAALAPMPDSRVLARRRMPVIPFLITLGVMALAVWGEYMGAPWTRDATVRAYVVTMAPEVAGHIVDLPVGDNKYVRKGDLLMARTRAPPS